MRGWSRVFHPAQVWMGAGGLEARATKGRGVDEMSMRESHVTNG